MNSSSTSPSGPPPADLALSNNPRGAVELGVCVFLMVVATIVVVLRLYARKFKGVNFAADDYIIVVALLCLYGNGIAECVGVAVGGKGLHMHQLSLDQIEKSLKALFAATISWTFSTTAIKVSLLLLYIRVFPQRPFRVAAYGLMGLVLVYLVACLIFFVANCQPFEANFNPGLPGAVCGNKTAGWLGTGVANIVTDIAILSLPMRNVYHLQLPSRTKMAVAGIFGIGFVVVIVSIVRLVVLLQIDLDDFTYSAVNADIFSALEPTLMISCACLPIMRPLFRRILPTNTPRYGYVRSNNGRNSLFASGKNSSQNAGHVVMAGHKTKNSPNKRTSLLGQDGFTRLHDIELKSATTTQSGSAPTTIMEREERPQVPEKPTDYERQWSGRQTPQLPNTIEVTTDIRVEME